MSVRVQYHVWEHTEQKGSALLLLLYLADCADDEGKNIYPSVDRMAKKTRMSERNVQYVLRKLESDGEITPLDDPSKYGTTMYQIQMGGCKVCTGGGAKQRTKGVQPVAPKPSVNPLDTSNEVTTKPYDVWMWWRSRHDLPTEKVRPSEIELKHAKNLLAAELTLEDIGRLLSWLENDSYWRDKPHTLAIMDNQRPAWEASGKTDGSAKPRRPKNGIGGAVI